MPLVTNGSEHLPGLTSSWSTRKDAKHHGRHTEPDHYPPRPGHGEIGPQWSNPRGHPKGGISSPHSSWGRPRCGKRGMCCCRAGVGPNACDWLGRSPERRPSAECCLRQVGSQKEDWPEDTLRRACLQWGRPTDSKESSKLHNTSEGPIPMLHT